MAQNQENNAWQKGSFKLLLTNPETQKQPLRVAPLGRSSPAPLGRSVTEGEFSDGREYGQLPESNKINRDWFIEYSFCNH